MANAAKLYLRYVGVSVRGQMQYRASFIMSTLGNMIITGIEFLVLWTLFARFGSLKGWTLAEVALFYGMVHTAFHICEIASRGFDTFGGMVRRGNFDRILLRPRSTALQLAGTEVKMDRIGRLAQGIAVLIWASFALGIQWTFGKLVLLLVSILCGACLFYGIIILQATLAFWTVESLEVFAIITYGGLETAQYPLPIYKQWLRKFFIFVIPLGCVNYFPILAILDRPDSLLNSPTWFHWLSPLVGVLFLLMSLQVWKFGVRHYRSTGS